MASTQVPINHQTLRGTFAGMDWEVFEAHGHPDQWGFSLTWGTPMAPREYEHSDLYFSPELARQEAFIHIARMESNELGMSDLASYCQLMEDQGS